MDDRAIRLMGLVGATLRRALAELAAGRPLCTFAAWEADHGRELAQADADTVAESVEVARSNLAEIEGLTCFAIATEGAVRLAGEELDAVHVEFGAPGAGLDGEAIYVFRRPFAPLRGPILRFREPVHDPDALRAAVVAALHAEP